jgi:receptor protein-tyrosine kinase
MKLIQEAVQRLEQLSRPGARMPRLSDARGDPGPDAVRRDADDDTPRRSVVLDLERLQAEGVLVVPSTRSTQAEQFRRMKRPLLANIRMPQASSQRLSLIMVTSALPGEGKTYCATNLALSLAAEIDQRVLLVDADVVHPQLASRLGVEAGAGLLDLLQRPSLQLGEVALGTNVDNLALLPAGAPDALTTERLAGAAMQRLLQRLATGPQRIVVFDAPPLLATNEAAVLAGQVGQVLLVVEASRTPAAAVRRAFDTLAQHPIVMSVLNKTRAPRPAARLGYYNFESAE